MYGFDAFSEGGLNSEALLKFIRRVEKGEASEIFKSQKKPKYEKYSR